MPFPRKEVSMSLPMAPRGLALRIVAGATFLLAANKDSRSVAVFRIDRARGTLRHLTTTTTGAAPYWVGVVTLPGP